MANFVFNPIKESKRWNSDIKSYIVFDLLNIYIIEIVHDFDVITAMKTTKDWIQLIFHSRILSLHVYNG